MWPQRFFNFIMSVNSEVHSFRIQIITLEVSVRKFRKIIANFLVPKSLWFVFHLPEPDGT